MYRQSFTERSATGTVHGSLHMRWPHDPFIEHTEWFHHFIGVGALQVFRTDQVVKSESGDGQQRNMIHLCIKHAIEQMHNTRAGGAKANTDLPCELCIS